MGSKLGDIHGWIEDFARGKRIKNFEVVCPATTISTGDNISKRDLSAYWGGDPVHLTPAGYEKLGEKLAEITVADPQLKKRERDSPQPDTKSQHPAWTTPPDRRGSARVTPWPPDGTGPDIRAS